MALPKLQKNLLREQLDKHTTFINSLTMADKVELQNMELEQIAFDAALQHRANFYGNRREKVVIEYRSKHGLGDILGKDDGTMPILPQEMIAVYLEKNPTSKLDGKELEDAAIADYILKSDDIDAELNTDIVGNGNSKFSIEQANMAAFNNTRAGIRDKLSNLKRAVITANWKE